MQLTSLEQVQARVGKLPAPRDLKVMDHLDDHSIRWLSYARFGFIAFSTPSDLTLTALGIGAAVFSVQDSTRLTLPLAALDDITLAEAGASFGALLLIHGMEESLRINGTVTAVDDHKLSLQVEECYLHCAKAFKRSGFWKAQPTETEARYSNSSEIIAETSFLVLATVNQLGQVDLSPKGDPAGLLIRQDKDALYIADRPGNRRIDSFRNILERPQFAVIAMVPGSAQYLEIKAEATLHDDKDLLESLAVACKLPKLVVKLTPIEAMIKSSEAIDAVQLWPAGKPPAEFNAAEIFKAHIKHSKESSLSAKLARVAVSLPGAFDKGLESDYKNNLY